MPEDRPDQETFEDVTAYRFGSGTSQEARSEETASEPQSTADIAEESARAVIPAEAYTHGNPLDPAWGYSTSEAGSDEAGTAGSGLSMTPITSPRPGDLLFGKYRVERLLGKGGMGEVWLVRHQILRDQFALKLIVPGAAIDEETVKRFVLEAQVMRALSRHPHAVVVHDADIDMGRLVIYIVMDVVHGCSIEKLLTPGVPMPLDWTAEVLAQLCDVLDQAHQLGIVHRDLSPANLMLEDQPDKRVYLRVLDFGVAKVLDRQSGVFDSAPPTECGRFYGKRSYASPEQLVGERVDPRSDLYSVGVILYEFLTGYRPFRGSPEKLLLDHCSTDPPRFAKINPAVKVPRQVETVVRRCLAKNPKDRPQSARELIDLFRAAAEKSGRRRPPELPVEEGEERLETSGQVHAEPPGWRAWLTRRTVAIGVTILVCLALPSLIPRLLPVRPPSPPPRIGPEVNEFLTSRQLRLIPGIGVAAGGCPQVVERIADQRRLVWHQGIYLPEDYEPEWDKGKIGVFPLSLVHKNGARFILVEGGDFVMGAFDPGIKDFDAEEKPGHRVALSSFYIQQTETTFGEFEGFCKETVRDRNDADLRDGFYYALTALRTKMNEEEVRKHPAVGVTRKLAEAYAHYVGGELPSEAQWEFAARSRGKNQLYVWGNSQEFPKFVNIKKPVVVGIETVPVGLSTDDRTKQGVLDLAGNVREWCRDIWKIYPEVEPARDPVHGPTIDDATAFYVIRGGSYETVRETARTTWRTDLVGKPYRAKNHDYDFDLGFRVVLDILEVPDDLIAHSQSKADSAAERAR